VIAPTAILDRFLQSAEVIQMTGRSFRLRGRQADKKDDQAIVDEAETGPIQNRPNAPTRSAEKDDEKPAN